MSAFKVRLLYIPSMKASMMIAMDPPMRSVMYTRVSLHLTCETS
jgi:hypothetical protein